MAAAYNPLTGITSYADPAPAPTAESPVPSTATTATSGQAYLPMPDTSWFTPSSWASSRNLGELERLLAAGYPVPPEAMEFMQQVSSVAPSGWSPYQSAGNQQAIWNDFVARVQDRESGGGGIFGIEEFSLGDPMLDGMFNYGQGAMWAGNVGGAALTGGDIGDAALQDVLALAGGHLAPAVSGAVGGGMLGAAAGGLATGGLNALVRGEDVGESALRGALTGGALRGGAELYADYMAPTSAPTATTETTLMFANAPLDDPLRRGMLPWFFAPAQIDTSPLLFASADTGAATDAGVDYLSGEGVNTGAGRVTGFSVAPGAYDLPSPPMANYLTGVGVETGFGRSTGSSQVPGAYDTIDGRSDLLPPSMADWPSTDAQLREQRVQEAARTIERYGKIGAALAQMNEGRGVPQDAPQRQEGQDDAAYAQTLVQYANLDAQAMAAAGLTPGTPEYYEFVMSQLDSVIDQITDGQDPNSPNLAAQMRTKTREELIALERALYVRGQIGQLMGSGRYLDPFTGLDEEVVVPEGMLTRPGVAAYHRGIARSADELARMSPMEARRYIGGFVDRDVDIYGMQAAADARRLQETLAAQDVDLDWKRRRGGVAVDEWRHVLDSLSPQQLRQLLASFGGDEDRTRAALTLLVG